MQLLTALFWIIVTYAAYSMFREGFAAWVESFTGIPNPPSPDTGRRPAPSPAGTFRGHG